MKNSIFSQFVLFPLSSDPFFEHDFLKLSKFPEKCVILGAFFHDPANSGKIWLKMYIKAG